MRRLTRREWLRWSGVGVAGLFHPPILSGCVMDSSRAGDRDAPFTPYEFDPNRPWWLQYNYAPVMTETTHADLEVIGAIPPELDGFYVRNGSNPSSGASIHWFVGDGMLHSVHLSGGKARAYRNRYVRTAVFTDPPPPGTLEPPTLERNDSNVSLVRHAGKLLTLGEVGLPYEIAPADLATVGPYDFGGVLKTAMTAHPKIDAVTGEMFLFGYGFSAPFLTYHRVDASGALVQSEVIDVPASSMMHDFQMTATRVIFMDMPIVFDLALAVDNILPFRWDGAHATRFGIMPRQGTNADIRWIDIEPCFIFHTLNAYDDPVDPNVVFLEAVRHEKLWVDGPNDFDSRPVLVRYRIDVATGTASLEPLDERIVEFPQLDRRLSGRPQRYGYALWLRDPQGDPQPPGVRGVLKYDLNTGSSTSHELLAFEHADEAIFVPAAADAGEDDGYLLTYVYDASRDKTDLVILDASRIESPPIARVRLPVRVPFGFHGIWVPAA